MAGGSRSQGLRIKMGRVPLLLLITFYYHRVQANFRTKWALASQKRSVEFLMRKPCSRSNHWYPKRDVFVLHWLFFTDL